VPFRFIGFDAQQFTLAQLKLLAARTRSLRHRHRFQCRDSGRLPACMDGGDDCRRRMVLHLTDQRTGKDAQSGQANIVRVLNLVRQNAEIREIEAALKQDVAISYKLLRYINTAGFGLSCEIQSFPARRQHARLRQAQPLAVTAAGDGEQGPDGARIDVHRAAQRPA
jgi:hypothetical protein